MKKVLIIDDDPDILEAIQMILQDDGYAAIADRTGDIINHLGGENMPDIILLDVLLSGKDGREIAKQLKSQDHTKHIPVIMISAHQEVENMTKEYGVDDVLSKPFNIDTLLNKVKKYSNIVH